MVTLELCMYRLALKADWRGIQGRMVLFLGNKHTGPSTNVRIVILHPSHLRIQSPPVPDTVPPRAQVRWADDTCVCIHIGLIPDI